MDNTISPSTSSTTGATSFPTSDLGMKPASSNTGAVTSPTSPSTSSRPVGTSASAADPLTKPTMQGLQMDADSSGADESSIVDDMKEGISKIAGNKDQWVESARDAIRQRPLTAVAGALVAGLALLSLRSSRTR